MHRARRLIRISDDVDKDTVSAVLQKGYMMGDAVLRPAKVQVAHN